MKFDDIVHFTGGRARRRAVRFLLPFLANALPLSCSPLPPFASAIVKNQDRGRPPAPPQALRFVIIAVTAAPPRLAHIRPAAGGAWRGTFNPPRLYPKGEGVHMREISRLLRALLISAELRVDATLRYERTATLTSRPHYTRRY